MLRIKFVKLTLFLITLFFFTSCAVGVRKPPPPPSDTSVCLQILLPFCKTLCDGVAQLGKGKLEYHELSAHEYCSPLSGVPKKMERGLDYAIRNVFC